MAEGKMFAGAKSVGKRVPKWAWYVSGGVLIAGGIYYFVSGPAEQGDEGTAYDEGAVGYTDASTMPGMIVAPQSPGEAVAAELNTDIPSETLGVFGTIFEGLFGMVEAGQAANADILAILANAGSPQVGADAGGVVTVNPPSSPPAQPKPNPAQRLEPGYHAGSTVNMGPNAKKTFPGAIGWVRIGDGDKGAAHWVDVHVRYCDKLERWRVRPNAKGSPWNKTWQGPRPGIC